MRRELTQDHGSVADAFESMDAFWAALGEHEAGSARGSIWDTYEAGERRMLERTLAEMFNAPDAVVVCSGMGAITVSAISSSIMTGDPLDATVSWGYFEVSDLVDNVLRPMHLVGGGSSNGQKDGFSQGRIASTTRAPMPRIVEPVANEPGLGVNVRILQEPASATIIDNSLFSVSLDWRLWRNLVSHPLLVVESIPKFLNRNVSGGVVYGDGDFISLVRAVARRTGMSLSRTACETVLNAGVAGVRDRVATHADRADVFAKTLRERRPELLIRVPHQIARAAGLAGACSSLVFVVYPEEGLCRREFDGWSSQARTLCGRDVVRAGYGWPATYGRAYGADRLNTARHTQYVRFSVGLEEETVVRELAAALADADPGRARIL